jgi:hypothetical protein
MMRAHRLAAAVAALLLVVSPVKAQQPAGATPQTPQPQAGQPANAAPPSADAMGVSLKSIRNRLKEAPAQPRAPGAGMRYDFYVDVLGKRPAVDFFKDFDLSTKGGVRWGGPTHQEVLDVMSPYWVNASRPAGSGVDVLAAVRKKK